RILIVTAIPIERAEVVGRLSDVTSERHPEGTTYSRGKFLSFDALVVESGAGNALAAIETERAVQFFQPELALFVGVAGGVKDVAIGDVVVATRVYGYERGVDATTFVPRPDFGLPSYPLVQHAADVAREHAAKAAGRDASWRVYLGPIAAGEKV